jgi:selenocysteine-specific elongation factor
VRTVLAGVIGHVDHGKTALVRALTGTDTDRLKEEKARGLSIVLGFSHLPAGEDGEIDLIDMPGHERFLRTMISGATGIEAALLAVAATEGIRPQTVEHAEIARLIGVRRGVVAITKCDLASTEQADRVAQEAVALAAANGLGQVPVVLTSTRSGDGLEALRHRLAALLDGQEERVDHGLFQLPIDRVFTAPGFGTVVTGTLRRGGIALGDEVEILPGGRRARVRGLQVHNRPVETAGPGRRVAVNLRGVERAQLRRGQSFATPGALAPARWLDAELVLLESAPRPLETSQAVRLLLGTSEVAARVRLLGRDRLEPGSSALVQLRCAEEVAVPAHEPFIIRTASPPRTIGGGRIIAPEARRRRRRDPRVVAEIRALAQDHPPAVLAAHLRRAGCRGSRLEELARLVGFTGARLGPWLEEAGGETLQDGTVVLQSLLGPIETGLLAALDAAHRRHPEAPGLTRSQLGQGLPQAVPAAVLDRALSRLAARGQIVHEGGAVRRRDFRPTAPAGPSGEALAQAIEQLFHRAGLSPPDPAEVIGRDRRRAQALRELVKGGVLVATFDRVQKREIVFHREAVLRARRAIEERLAHDGGFLAGEAGRLLGISRKYSIPLLEYLDAVHCTRRIGDRRLVTRPQPPRNPPPDAPL